MATQNKTAARTHYSTIKDLREAVNELVNDDIHDDGLNIRKLTTNIHFDVEDDEPRLTDATDELIILMCAATFRSEDELCGDRKAVIAHGAELAGLVNRCMQEGNYIDVSDVIYYSRKLSEERKKVGLIQYEDICGK